MKKRLFTATIIGACALLAPTAAYAIPNNVTDALAIDGGNYYHQNTRFTSGTGQVRATPTVTVGSSCAMVYGPWRGKNLTSSTAKFADQPYFLAHQESN